MTVPSLLGEMDRRFLIQYNDLKKEKKEIQARTERLEREISSMGNDKTDLLIKKLLLSQHKAILTTLELEILEKTNILEQELAAIDDSYIRRIVSFRVIDGLSWADVTAKMGTNYTIDSIKKAFYRYFD